MVFIHNNTMSPDSLGYVCIQTDKEGTPQAHLVIGAAGGTRIPTATAQGDGIVFTKTVAILALYPGLP